MAIKPNKLSRADQVRARRSIEPVQRKPIPRMQERISREERSASRVISRHGSYRSSGTYTSSNHSRKPVYLSTGTPGSELRLPALPKLTMSWRILSTLIAVASIVLLFMMWSGDTFRVNTVNLSGGIRVPMEEVKASLNVTGDSIIFAQPQQVEAQILEKFPDIKKAHVSIEMPDALNIVIEERIPAILWFEDNEELFWIDQEGFTFTVRGEANLPIRIYSDTTPPQSLGYIDPYTLLTPEEMGKLEFDPRISPVDPGFVLAVQKLNTIKPADTPMLFTKENGLGWDDPNGWQVFFGNNTEDIDLKLIEYSHIVQAILDRNLQPVLISMEFLHAPFYRLEH
jgi:cell division protein FtsQ